MAPIQNKRSMSFKRNCAPIIFGRDDRLRSESRDSAISYCWKYFSLSNTGPNLGTKGPNCKVVGCVCSAGFKLRLVLHHNVKSANHNVIREI